MIIDVSYANKNLDYAKIKETCEGMIIRIGYRGSIKGKSAYKKIVFDNMYETHLKGAKKYNIPHGYYFFPTSISDPEAIEEAQWLVNNLPDDSSYPVFLDSEKVTGTARADELSPKFRTMFLKVICDYLLARGIPCGIYASQWWAENQLIMSEFPQRVIDNTWIAQNPKLTYKGYCALWQYGTVDIGGVKVDANKQLKPFNYDRRRTVEYYRSTIIDKAIEYIGCSTGSTLHKQIIDAYNNYGSKYGLPRNYKVKYTDAWCATFVSAIAIMCGYTPIIPVECGCPQMVQKAKSMGIWQENDAYVPKEADIILYDWEDSRSGDNTGNPDHIGYVECVKNGLITVIEGNFNDAVRRRSLNVNGKYIRGFITPKYTATAPSYEPKSVSITLQLPELHRGDKNEAVRVWQSLLHITDDGDFGQKTEQATRKWQRENGKTVDGWVGKGCYTKMAEVNGWIKKS